MIFDYSIGLDISTSCTGIAVLDSAGSVRLLSYYRPSGNSLVEKAADLNDYVKKIWNENNFPNPKNIYIEQNLQRFRRGFSSAQVLNTLARFNGMISYAMFQHFGEVPVYINVNEGRKSLGIKIPRGSDTKEEILKWCKVFYPKLTWKTKTLKSGPRKGLVILDPCCYDMADALVTVTAGLKLNNDV